MIDQLLALIKNNSQEAIVNNPEVPNEMNEPAMEVASNSILESLRGFSESDIQQIQNDVQNNNIDMNSQQMGFLGGNMTDGLMKKLGLNSGAAKTIGAILLPLILKQLFSNKSNAGAAAPAVCRDRRPHPGREGHRGVVDPGADRPAGRGGSLVGPPGDRAHLPGPAEGAQLRHDARRRSHRRDPHHGGRLPAHPARLCQ